MGVAPAISPSNALTALVMVFEARSERARGYTTKSRDLWTGNDDGQRQTGWVVAVEIYDQYCNGDSYSYSMHLGKALEARS